MERNQYYMELARLTAQRGTCERAKVGAVLVDKKTKRIIGIGYNSSPKGTMECSDDGCLIHNGHCIRCLHAEQAAVLNMTSKSDDVICYTTHQPCLNCLKILIAANVSLVIYNIPYKDEARDLYAKEALFLKNVLSHPFGGMHLYNESYSGFNDYLRKMNSGEWLSDD